MVGLGPEEGRVLVIPWEDWDPVMQEDYLAEIDLTLDEELIMEIRRQVLDKTRRRDVKPRSLS